MTAAVHQVLRKHLSRQRTITYLLVLPELNSEIVEGRGAHGRWGYGCVVQVIVTILAYLTAAAAARFDSQHVSNGSDDGGRYTYEAQPAICRWNLERLAEALEKTPLPGGSSSSSSGGGSVLPASRARKGLAEYEREFERCRVSGCCLVIF